MPNRELPRPERETTPPVRETATIPQYPGSAYDPTLQLIWEMKGDLESIKKSVEHLEVHVNDHGKQLSGIGRKVHTAEVALGIIGVVASGAGYLMWHLLSNVWDVLSPLITVSIKH